MAKLKGKAKEEFLKRMAAGRRKANGRKKPAKSKGIQKTRGKAKKRAAPKKRAPKKTARTATRTHTATKRRKAPQRAPKRRRRNPDTIEAAADQFRKFHGKAPGRILEYSQVYEYPANYAELGKLVELRFDLNSHNRDFPLTQFGATQAVCTPDGANIYLIGGDMRVDLGALDIATEKDFVELGPCTYICYDTVKGFHDFRPMKYWHRFGEENGIKPVLVYDRRNKALFLVSGDYRVKPEGITN